MPASRPFRAAWAVAVALVCAAAGAHPLFESDTWWHLGLGRAVVETGSRTVPEPMAYVAPGTLAHSPEWLFDVATWLGWQAGGDTGLVAISAVIAGFAGMSVALLALRSGKGPAALVVGGLAAAAVLTRVRLRPEVVALGLAAWTLLLAEAWRARAPGKGRGAGIALVVTALVWVQVHGSFFMAAALAAIAGIDPAKWRDPARRREDLVLLGGVLAVLPTGTYGMAFPGLVLAHSSGTAADHVADLRGLTWATLDPANGFAEPGWLVLLALPAAGALASPVRVSDLALLAVGLALPFNAARFLSLSAIVLVGPAIRGAETLWRLGGRAVPRFAPAALGLVGLAAVLEGARRIDADRGPLGTAGVLLGTNPMAGARALAEGPPRVVVTGYRGGSAVGFFGWKAQRATLDSRVPLLFDGPDFAERYLAELDPVALAGTVARTGATAIVLGREAPACGKVPPGFTLAVVEPGWSTWVSDGSLPPITAFEPCGDAWSTPATCDAGAADLDRISRWSDPTFLAWARGRLALDCAHDATAALAALPDPRRAGFFDVDVRRARAEALQAAGHPDDAVDAAETDLRGGDLTALSVLTPALRAVAPSRACDVLLAATHRLLGVAPADLRGEAAMACLRAGDERNGGEQALAAASAGSRTARPALAWLAKNAADPHLRDEAEAWLSVRTAEAP